MWVLGLSLKTRLQVFAKPPLFLWWPTLENYVGVLCRADFLQAFVNTLIVSSSAVAAVAVRRRAGGLRVRALSVHRAVVPVLHAAGDAHAAAHCRAGADVRAVQQDRPDHDAVQRRARLHHVQPAAGGLDHARLLRGSAGRAGGERLDRRRQPLSTPSCHIVLPLARPGMVAASILCLQLAWNDFLFAAVLTNNATQTLPVLMAAFSGGDSGVDWGGLTASGVLVILPVIIFSFVAQRHLVAGLSSGAVKG